MKKIIVMFVAPLLFSVPVLASNYQYISAADLKDKIDKTEFVMQYKEDIWTALEKEIRKVVSKDS